MVYDVVILGGGVAGVSCALVLGSAYKKTFVANKKIALIAHQKTSSLQEALFNNAYGIPAGTLGADLLSSSLEQLNQLYPHIDQIQGEKVFKIEGKAPHFTVYTNKKTYDCRSIVVAIGYANTFDIEGLMPFVAPHPKAVAEKQRIYLRNHDHLVSEGIYVAGTLAGWRSQLAIAAGSGAAVATDILTVWNNGIDTQSHDRR